MPHADREARRLYSQEYQRRHRERLNAQARARRAANVEKYRRMESLAYAKNPDRWREVNRRSRLKHKYGLRPSQHARMSEQQGGRCVICGSEPNGKAKLLQVLHVDHDHFSGKVRGLLCNSCNRGLGLFRDNAEALRRAAAYLEQHK